VKFFFSNRLQVLLEKSVPFFSEGSPFRKRYVVTPNRTYFQKAFASLAQICSGIEFMTLLQAIECFSQKDFPSSLELLIAMNKKLQEKAVEIPMPIEKESLSSLCDLFFKYGQYGGSLIEAFETPKDWQESLFHEIFFQDQCPFPYRELKEVSCPDIFRGTQIHIFGFSFLPKLYLDFFQRLSKEVEINLYFLSPCRYFWEDLCSDRERISLQRFWKKKGASEEEREMLDGYLRESHPLLANLGKLGRKNLEQIGSWDFWGEEEYKVPKAETCLEIIQKDLLDLEDVKPELTFDSSLQVHACGSSKLREVQVLFQNLLSLIHKNTWNPSDILVLAPQIEEYAPFIHYIFSDGTFPYRISGLPVRENSFFAQGMIDLLSLVDSRWEKDALLDLFENPLFGEKHSLSKEEVKLFRKWLQQSHIQWGWDSSSRKKYLEESWKSDPQGSFSDGIQRTIDALIQPDASFSLDWTDTDTLHKILRLLRSLKEDTTFIEQSPHRTLAEWEQIFSLFSEQYFGLSQGEGVSTFQTFLTGLEKASKQFPDELIPFSWLYDELKKEWDAKSFHFHSHLLSAISFATLSEKNLSPYKMIYLIGMDEESFPQVELPSPFDKLIKHKGSDYCPSRGEKDRYLFLQCFLHAEECLWINYRHICAKDGQKQNPSTVLQDFFSYLERSFAKTLTPFIHPALCFHKSYYQHEHAILPQSLYKAALGHYQKEKSYSLLSSIEKPTPLQTSNKVIPIESIRLLLKDPIGFFCQEVLQIKLYREEEAEIFQLSPLDRYKFRKDILKAPFEEVWAQWMRDKPLPFPFCEREKEKMKKEVQPIIDLGIEEIFSLQCTESMGDHCFLPVMINGVKIVGSIPDICEKGILSNSSGTFQKRFRIWGDLLLFSLLPHEISHRVYFLKKDKPEKSFHISHPEASLEKLVHYYLFAKEHLSPLRETWIKEIYEGKGKELQKAVQKDFLDQSLMNPYQQWIFSHNKHPDAEDILQKWNSFTHELMQPLDEAFS